MKRTTLAYGVWTKTQPPMVTIYCPKCVKCEDRYDASELTGLNGDTCNCHACGALIQDLA